MLVLGRKVGERVHVVVHGADGDHVLTVIVAAIRGDKVRIGFSGDREVFGIARDELAAPQSEGKGGAQ